MKRRAYRPLEIFHSMPRASSETPRPALLLICGDDEFTVKKRAREIFDQWCAEAGGMDHEIIEAAASNNAEALHALARLREALQTLPFFGSTKVIWLRNANFLSEERAAGRTVAEALDALTDELKRFQWENVRLLISAGKVDRRKAFFKTIEKIGAVESFAALSAEDKDWAERAALLARNAARARGMDLTEEALAELVSRVGPHTRQLEMEVEKLCLFAADKKQIEPADVHAVCCRNRTARAFALGDALGDRDLPRLLRRLDEELWEIRAGADRDKSVIGLLYGLIFKIRALLLLKEMLREGWIRPTDNYSHFKTQLERVPKEKLPADRKFNPLALNPYVLYKALPQVKKYSPAELVRAMELLLRANQRLVSSGLDETLVLQQTLAEIILPPASPV